MVEPDYTEPLKDLNIRAAYALLLNPREAPHVLLRVVHNTKEELEDDDYPTLVPRWRTLLDTHPRPIPLTHGYENRLKPYRAGRDSSTFTARTGPGNTITVTGLLFDTVTWISLILKIENLRSNVRLWEPRFRDANISAIEMIWQELLNQVKRPLEQLASNLSLTVVWGRPDHVNNFLAYCELLRSLVGSENISPFPPPGSDQGVPSEGEWAITRCRDRRFAYTTNKRLALVPLAAEDGDICCIIQGADTPVVLRQKLQDTYKFVGDAYVNGVMESELMQEASQGPPKWETIRIR
jgi:hypothetical protein